MKLYETIIHSCITEGIALLKLYNIMHRDVCQCPPCGMWLYRAVTALLVEITAELTLSTAMLVYTLFLSSPVKL